MSYFNQLLILNALLSIAGSLIGVWAAMWIVGYRPPKRPKPRPEPVKPRGDIWHNPFHRHSEKNAVEDGFHLRDYLLAILDHYGIEHWRVQLGQMKNTLELTVHQLGLPAKRKVFLFDENKLKNYCGDIRDMVWGQARLMLLGDEGTYTDEAKSCELGPGPDRTAAEKWNVGEPAVKPHSIDNEFTIGDVVRNDAGLVLLLLAPSEKLGLSGFSAPAPGNMEERTQMLEERSSWIGGKAQVRYDGVEDRLPKNPKVLKITRSRAFAGGLPDFGPPITKTCEHCGHTHGVFVRCPECMRRAAMERG